MISVRIYCTDIKTCTSQNFYCSFRDSRLENITDQTILDIMEMEISWRTATVMWNQRWCTAGRSESGWCSVVSVCWVYPVLQWNMVQWPAPSTGALLATGRRRDGDHEKSVITPQWGADLSRHSHWSPALVIILYLRSISRSQKQENFF